jgi:hypothetical protein
VATHSVGYYEQAAAIIERCVKVVLVAGADNSQIGSRGN